MLGEKNSLPNFPYKVRTQVSNACLVYFLSARFPPNLRHNGNSMSKYDEKRNIAQPLYTKGKLSRKEICNIVGIAEKTLRAWIEKYNWDDLKEAYSVTRQQLLADAYTQLKAVNQRIEEKGGIPDKTLTDAKSVLRKEIELLSDSPVHVYIEVFQEVTEWLMSNHPSRAAEISQLLLTFIEEKSQS